MSHFQSQIVEPNVDETNNHNNRGSVIIKAPGGKKIISSFREGEEDDGARVQVISDFDSQDNEDADKYSIEMTS